jgi:transcriptional regulator with XRE-family HTH domain
VNKTKNYLGEIIYRSRLDNQLTQDEFGARYSVSGPAVFKFEKGYVRPSLELWLRMAGDAGIPERRAVLLWLKSKLPAEYQDYVELQGAAVAEKGASGKGRKRGEKAEKTVDYSTFEIRKDMQDAAQKDKTLPKALRELLDDDELWGLFKPTGHEINMLRDVFGSLGRGSKSSYREALRLIREFTHSF